MHRDRRVTPPLVLAAGIAALALLLALSTAVRIPGLASLDETVYKLSATQYAADGLGALLDDRVARGVARLYSLVIAPFFALLPGDSAVEAARAFNSLLFALAAVPVFLLARRLTSSPWTAVAAALLSVAVPWATVSTVLFSEALAYLLFAWLLYAMPAALRAPSLWRDALVVGLILALVATRAQFVGLPVAWAAVVLALRLPPARRSAGSWRAALLVTWRQHPVVMSGMALAVLIGAGAFLAGRLGPLLRRVGGPYAADRNQLPDDVGMAVLFEVAMLALGTGVVPLILAGLWARHVGRGASGAEPVRVLVSGGAAVAAVFAIAVLGQRGFQGAEVTEERYFIYAVPLILVGALAALELPGLRARSIAWGGALVACLFALAPTTAGLSGERAFLVPVAASARNLSDRINPWLADRLGLVDATGERDLIVVLAIVVVLLSLAGLRRARWLALVPAVVVQLGFGAYALATMHGRVPGVPGLTGAGSTEQLAWVDRATPGDPAIGYVNDRVDPERRGALDLTFWNDELRTLVRFTEVNQPDPPYPVSALPEVVATVGPDLRLTAQPPRLVLTAERSPVVQLAGREVARREGSGVVRELERPARATWVARALGHDGAVPGPVAIGAEPARLTLELEAGAEGPGGGARAVLGDVERTVAVPPGQRKGLRISTCGAGGPVAGTLEPANPPGGGVLLKAVRVEPCP